MPDHVYVVDVTPNRGDALSVRGLARDLAAVNQLSCQSPWAAEALPEALPTWPIEISTPACDHYVGLCFERTAPWPKTPMWMQLALLRAGLTPAHFIVDVTQFVMLDPGQPMYAYDLGAWSGEGACSLSALR